MAQPNEALRAALAAAERLPLKLRRQLAERLLASSDSKEGNITIRLRRLPQGKQRRLTELMDKNSEGALTASERAELRALGTEVDRAMLLNSLALARAGRPELFDANGRLIKKRFNQATSIQPRQENTRR